MDSSHIEIVRLPDNLQKRHLTNEEKNALIGDYKNHRITSFNGIKIGDHILAMNLGEWNVVTVEEIRSDRKNGSAISASGTTLYMLEFGRDERQCWVCIGAGSLGVSPPSRGLR